MQKAQSWMKKGRAALEEVKEQNKVLHKLWHHFTTTAFWQEAQQSREKANLQNEEKNDVMT